MRLYGDSEFFGEKKRLHFFLSTNKIVFDNIILHMHILRHSDLDRYIFLRLLKIVTM